MAGLRDGLGFNVVQQSGQAGPASNHGYFLGSVTSESLITGTAIKGTTYSGTNANFTTVTSAIGQLGPFGIGSPTTWGLAGQTGSAIASNVAVTVTFGTAFRAIPYVQATQAGSSPITFAATASGTTATAFGLIGVSGQTYNWLAIGSV